MEPHAWQAKHESENAVWMDEMKRKQAEQAETFVAVCQKCGLMPLACFRTQLEEGGVNFESVLTKFRDYMDDLGFTMESECEKFDIFLMEAIGYVMENPGEL